MNAEMESSNLYGSAHDTPASSSSVPPEAEAIEEEDLQQHLQQEKRNKKRTLVRSLEFSELPGLVPGDEVHMVTISPITHIPRVQTTHVKGKGYFLFGDTSPPKFRPMNWDCAITLHKPMNDEAGVLVDDTGRARALWLVSPGNSYLGMGLESGSVLRELIDYFSGARGVRGGIEGEGEGRLPMVRMVDVELTETYFWKARELGLSEDWIARITAARAARLRREGGLPTNVDEEEDEYFTDYDEGAEEDHGIIDGDKYTIITVRRTPATPLVQGQSFEYPLREGDLILAIDGKPVTQMTDLIETIFPDHQQPNGDVVSTDDANNETDGAANPHSTESTPPVRALYRPRRLPESVDLTIFRDGSEVDIRVPTKLLDGTPRVDVVHWAGAIFQMPHRTLSFHVKKLPLGVYVSLLYSGSPAQRDGMSACWFVVEVDGKRTSTLEELLDVVEGPDWNDRVPVVNPIGQGWAEFKQEQSQTPMTQTTTPTRATQQQQQRQQQHNELHRESSLVAKQLFAKVLDAVLERPALNRLDSGKDVTALGISEGATKTDGGADSVEALVETQVQGEMDEAAMESQQEEDKKKDQKEEDAPSSVESVPTQRASEPIKGTISKSFRVHLVSLEQVHKVVTVDVCMASKNYFPTWRCVVTGK
ncbi:serine protease [Quaeritorhiza haematococci]|nr:serine protease [Quaeritorhiza haematococci]